MRRALLTIFAAGFALCSAAFSQGFFYGIGGLIVGAIAILLAALVLRVYMELIAVVFRIAKNTREIADNTAGGAA